MSEAAAAGAFERTPAVTFGFAAPVDPVFGELACDVALVLARRLRRPAIAIAQSVCARLGNGRGWLRSAEVGGPGYVNLRFAAGFWRDLLAEATVAGRAWGFSTAGAGRRVLVRCPVSADALDVVRARAAVAADAVARLLRTAGFAATAAPEGCAAEVLARLDVPDGPTGIGPDAERCTIGPVGAVRVLDGWGSPRRGLEELIEAFGPSALRLVLLAEPLADAVELDVDLGTRPGGENPLGEMEYALVRAARLRRAGAEAASVPPSPRDLERLGEPEVGVLRALAAHPDVLAGARRRRAPHHLVGHARDLAAAFHRYYNRHHVITDDPALTRARLALVRSVEQVLGAALELIGVPVTDHR